MGYNLTGAEVEHLTQIKQTLIVVCSKGLFPPICIAGMVANALNIVVLTRAWMSSSTNIYLTAVAVLDLIYLALSLLFSFWFNPEFQIYGLFARIITVVRPTANLCSNTTTWLTLCFTIERYVAVSYPILGRRICTQKRARCAVVCIVMFSFVVTFPDYLTYDVITPPSNTSQLYRIQASHIFDTLNRIGYLYINQAVFVFIPMILLIVFNTLLIRSVLRASKGRKTLAQQPTAPTSKAIPKLSTGRSETSVPYTPTELQMDDRPEPNPVLVKGALEASMKTTLELASGISQSFGQPNNNIKSTTRSGLNPSVRTRKSMLGEQHRITLMLITIVIAFILLQLPSTVPFVGKSLMKGASASQLQKWDLYMRIYVQISNLLLILSGAMNFVFYSLFSAKFRRTCCMLLQRFNCVPMRSSTNRSGLTAQSSARSGGYVSVQSSGRDVATRKYLRANEPWKGNRVQATGGCLISSSPTRMQGSSGTEHSNRLTRGNTFEQDTT